MITRANNKFKDEEAFMMSFSNNNNIILKSNKKKLQNKVKPTSLIHCLEINSKFDY